MNLNRVKLFAVVLITAVAMTFSIPAISQDFESRARENAVTSGIIFSTSDQQSSQSQQGGFIFNGQFQQQLSQPATGQQGGIIFSNSVQQPSPQPIPQAIPQQFQQQFSQPSSQQFQQPASPSTGIIYDSTVQYPPVFPPNGIIYQQASEEMLQQGAYYNADESQHPANPSATHHSSNQSATHHPANPSETQLPPAEGNGIVIYQPTPSQKPHHEYTDSEVIVYSEDGTRQLQPEQIRHIQQKKSETQKSSFNIVEKSTGEYYLTDSVQYFPDAYTTQEYKLIQTVPVPEEETEPDLFKTDEPLKEPAGLPYLPHDERLELISEIKDTVTFIYRDPYDTTYFEVRHQPMYDTRIVSHPKILPPSPIPEDQPLYDTLGKATIYFHNNDPKIDFEYQRNKEAIALIKMTLRLLNSQGYAPRTQIVVQGYASPLGSQESNFRLAFNRAKTVEEYLRKLQREEELRLAYEKSIDDPQVIVAPSTELYTNFVSSANGVIYVDSDDFSTRGTFVSASPAAGNAFSAPSSNASRSTFSLRPSGYTPSGIAGIFYADEIYDGGGYASYGSSDSGNYASVDGYTAGGGYASYGSSDGGNYASVDGYTAGGGYASYGNSDSGNYASAVPISSYAIKEPSAGILTADTDHLALDIKSESMGEDWVSFIESVEKDYHRKNRQEVLDILYDTIPNEEKKQALKTMDRGATWAYLVKHNMETSRNAVSLFIVNKRAMTSVAKPVKTVQDTTIVRVHRETPVPVIEEYIPKEPIRYPVVAFRTNLLVPGLNAGVELPLGNHWSVAADWYYPWFWPKKDNKNCFELLGGTAEVRYWFGRNRTEQRRLLGHSIGVYAAGGYYDFEKNYHGMQGEFWSAGLDYTYALGLGKKKSVRMEFTLALGHIHSNGQTYDVLFDGGALIPDYRIHKFRYWGPTKVAVNLVIPIFKKK